MSDNYHANVSLLYSSKDSTSQSNYISVVSVFLLPLYESSENEKLIITKQVQFSIPFKFSDKPSPRFISYRYLLIVDSHENLNICGEKNKILTSHAQIKSLGGTYPWVVFAGNDTTATVFNLHEIEKQFTIRSYRSIIKYAIVEPRFDTLICGTRDCYLLFCSLSKRSMIISADLNGQKPRLILITQSFGFVVVLSETFEFDKKKIYFSSVFY